jgi:hypothetical protein
MRYKELTDTEKRARESLLLKLTLAFPAPDPSDDELTKLIREMMMKKSANN